MREDLAFGLAVMTGLLGLNAWMTRRVIGAPSSYLPHKGLVLIGLWLMPFLGAFMARSHLRTYVPGETHRHLRKRWQGRVVADAAPAVLELPGVPPLDLTDALQGVAGLPLLNMPRVRAWLDAMPDDKARSRCAGALAEGWLLHVRDALGPRFRVHRSDAALMLSSAEPCVDEANADAITAMRKAAVRWVGWMVAPSPHRVIVSFVEDDPTCERLGAGPHAEGRDDTAVLFVSHATSSVDVRSIESALVREFVSVALSGLPLPTWLRQGLVEHAAQELAGDAEFGWMDPQMHEEFWDEAEIQSFWSGDVFAREDDGAALGRGLARLLVAHLAEQRDAFQQFVRAASLTDAGAQAARDQLGVDLGACACILLGHEPAMSWSPRSFSVV